jgi:hypothetical protein
MQSANPIYQRLTHNARLPSLRVALWAAFGIGLTVGAGVLWETLHLTYDGAHIGSWIAIIGLLVTFLSPFVTAIVAATLTSRDVQRDDFKLMRLAGISHTAIIAGYVSAVLHRVRWLLSALVALWPGIVIGWAQFSIFVLVVFQNITTSTSRPTQIPNSVSQATVISGALVYGGLSLWFWLLCGVAAVVGVSGGLAGRGASGAAFDAPMIMLVNVIAPWLPLFFAGQLGPAWVQTTSVILFAVIITGVTLWASLRYARRNLQTAQSG